MKLYKERVDRDAEVRGVVRIARVSVCVCVRVCKRRKHF